MGVSPFDLHEFFVVGHQILQFNSAVLLPVRELMAHARHSPRRSKRTAKAQPAIEDDCSRGRAQLDEISVPWTRSLEEEPGAALGFIDPNFDETRSGDVAMFIANVVRLTQARGQGPVVVS